MRYHPSFFRRVHAYALRHALRSLPVRRGGTEGGVLMGMGRRALHQAERVSVLEEDGAHVEPRVDGAAARADDCEAREELLRLAIEACAQRRARWVIDESRVR